MLGLLGLRQKRRLILATVLVMFLAAVIWLFVTPPGRVQFENESGGALRDVVLTFPDGEVVLGDVEAGGRREIAADDISSIRYHWTRSDGTRIDAATGFTPDEVFGRIYIRITAANHGTRYDLATAVKVDVVRHKLRRWLSQLLQ
jgi:hypothetical protein